MFKLVAVGGKIRGSEFVLKEGENVIGRAADADIVISTDGLSKKHMRLTVNGDNAFIEDLGSSNGTFVNDKLTRKMTVKDGDKITLPNVIFQIVYVAEKTIIVKKQVSRASEEDVDLDIADTVPASLGGKMIYAFKTKVMPIIYNFNEQYEWSALVGILLFFFIGINVSLIIFPVLRESKRLLVREIAMRGKQYADEVARTNSVPLSRRSIDKVDTNFLESAEGVQSYELFDFDGRIVRPITQLSTYVKDPLSVEALNFYKDSRNLNNTYVQSLSQGVIGIGRAIKAYDVTTGREETVGVVAIRFAPRSLAVEAANNSSAFLESLVTSSMVAIIFYGMLYFLTIRPIIELRTQTEQVLRGRRKELDSSAMFRELSPLRSTINSLLQRLRELQNTDNDETQSTEDEAPYIRTLLEFMVGSQGPVMVLSGENLIQGINLEAEDLIGIRQTASQGMSLLDAARDQGFAATLMDLCDQSANTDGAHQRENYEIGGKDIAVNVVALMGKDKFAKAYYVTLVRAT